MARATVKKKVVEDSARDGFKPPDSRSPWEWAEDNYVVGKSSPMPGKWKHKNSPWVCEFMECFSNDEIETLTAMCSAQSSKTETVMILLCWLIVNDPGPCMWVTSNEDEATKFYVERLLPALEACKPIKKLIPKDRSRRKLKEILFSSMIFEMIGSNAPSKLQSKPRRWLLLDEVRNWPKRALPTVLKRSRAFWNARRVIISTPGREKDHVHASFLEGDQRHLYVCCPDCKLHQRITWDKIIYDTDEDTCPEGEYDFDKLAKTVRFQCDTGCKIPDVPSKRAFMVSNAIWKAHNPSAPKRKVSFTWSALLPPWVKWAGLVEEFINANKALEWGDHEPLRTFITESLAEPWTDELKYKEETKLDERKVSYNIREEWEDEKRRFIGVDVQKDCIYFVCRAFGSRGRSRLIDYDKLINFDELDEKVRELGVNPEDVAIDAAHKSQEVYKVIARSGYKYKAFWGSDKHFFLYGGLRRSWSMNQVDPAIGTRDEGRVQPIKLYWWSNPSIKDKLELLMRGDGPDWEIPEKISQEYLDQLTAERRVEFEDQHGHESFKYVKIRKDDHLRDCESMIIAAATITNSIGFQE